MKHLIDNFDQRCPRGLPYDALKSTAAKSRRVLSLVGVFALRENRLNEFRIAAPFLSPTQKRMVAAGLTTRDGDLLLTAYYGFVLLRNFVSTFKMCCCLW